MYGEVYCNQSYAHIEVSPLKMQVNIALINKDIIIFGILILFISYCFYNFQ